jgi:hypothetical protein
VTLLRQYEPHELGADGYPFAWHRASALTPDGARLPVNTLVAEDLLDPQPPIKDHAREQAGHRCVRCGHPYSSGEHGTGEWSPCDDSCTHAGPVRYRFSDEAWCDFGGAARDGWRSDQFAHALAGADVQALWRILTVHHLDGDKANCRWWNLAALCQRCHLEIQGRVKMKQLYVHPHTDWFKPFAAGYYAHTYLQQDLTREETLARLGELLALELDPSYH